MAIEFLGHKNNLLDFIFGVIEKENISTDGSFIDLFSGTGCVSAAAMKVGFEVKANDMLGMCNRFAEAALLNKETPDFNGVLPEITGNSNTARESSPFELVIEYLNALPPTEGYIWSNYSPASLHKTEHERMYFTESNAGKIDAIREKIKSWKYSLTKAEESLLIVSLMKAANRVANTAGTYGCYLKKWKKRALNQLKLETIEVVTSDKEHQTYNEDANELIKKISGTVVYADPPYTKRQYAAYYHLLETIALADEPTITGSTGLRKWQDLSSDYCYKRKAPNALEDLVSKANCQHFLLSYNEDGQIPHEKILAILNKYGSVTTHEKQYKRYKSSSITHKGNYLCERVYHLKMKQ